MSTGQVEEHEQRLVHSDDIELATLEWVWWFNHHRLLEPIGHVPPAEFETQYYRSLESPSQEIEAPESPSLR